jgi:hypothetical protein
MAGLGRELVPRLDTAPTYQVHFESTAVICEKMSALESLFVVNENAI